MPARSGLNAAAHGRKQQAEVEQHLHAVLAHFDAPVRATAPDRQHITLPLTAHAELAGQACGELVGLFAGRVAAEVVERSTMICAMTAHGCARKGAHYSKVASLLRGTPSSTLRHVAARPLPAATCSTLISRLLGLECRAHSSGESDMTDPRKAHDAEPTTHFGYKNVPESQKAQKVAEVFHSVAAKYDLMNDLMSGGIHRLWKRFTIELSGARHGNRILDIAGGTGDLTRQFSRIVGPTGEVVLADINASMLKVGRDKLLDKGVAGNVRFVGPMPRSCLPGQLLRRGHHRLRPAQRHPQGKTPSPAMLRVLKPGGRLLVLEFSKPTNQLFSKAYDAYSFSLLPMMGKLITNDSESYRYGRIDPHAPRSGNPQGHDGSCRFRARQLPQHDRRHRRPAPRHQALMLRAASAGAERGINRVLRLDPTALPRLARLSGRVIEIDCMAPAAPVHPRRR